MTARIPKQMPLPPTELKMPPGGWKKAALRFVRELILREARIEEQRLRILSLEDELRSVRR